MVASEAGSASGRRVIVADDDVLLREGLASLLERAGYRLVGQAGDGSELLRLARELRPDLVIVDIRMPPTHSTEGLDAAGVIREELPEIAILILSAHVEVAHAMTLLGKREPQRLPAEEPRDGYRRVPRDAGTRVPGRLRRRPEPGSGTGVGSTGSTIRSMRSRRANARCSP